MLVPVMVPLYWHSDWTFIITYSNWADIIPFDVYFDATPYVVEATEKQTIYIHSESSELDENQHTVLCDYYIFINFESQTPAMSQPPYAVQFSQTFRLQLWSSKIVVVLL